MSTKRLARELGLIRKRSQSSSIHKRPSTSNQFFSYLIVIDFESTCWRERNNFGQEIIEFPAVLLNAASGEIESEFHSYVQPQEHPVLSSFCTELTGITQEQVEAGLPLPVCLSRFARWIRSLQQEKGVAFLTQTPPPTADAGSPVKPCSFVTWSDWDLGVCLLYECKRKQITKPEVLNSWIDLRATYRIFYDRKPKGLNGALQDLGITFSGREHSGLDDARNTARLACRMIGDGCVLKSTKSLSGAPLRSGPSTEQGRGHKSACTDATPSSDRTATTTHTSVCQSLVRPRTVLSALTTPGCVNTTVITPQTHPEAPGSDWSDEYLPAEAESESGSYDDVVLEDASTDAATDSPDKTRPLHSVPPIRDPYRSLTRPGVPKTPSIPFSIYIDQSDRSSSLATFRVPSVVLAPSVNQSALRTGSSNQSALRTGSSNQSAPLTVNQSALRTGSSNQSALRTGSSNQSALRTGSSNQSAPLTVNQSVHLSSFTNQSALNSISINQSALSSSSINQSRSFISGNRSALSSSSVNQSSRSSFSSNQSALSSSSLHQSALCFSKRSSLPPQRGGVKITSPLCDCGRRSKRLTVCNGGPNQGRAFYTCAVRRSSSPAPLNPAPRSKGCGFFKWESALVKSSLPIGRNSSSLGYSVSSAASRSFR